MPPNYDEIDPPPSYSTLFPGKNVEPETSGGTTSTNPSPTSNLQSTTNNCATSSDTTNAIVPQTSTIPLPSSSTT